MVSFNVKLKEKKGLPHEIGLGKLINFTLIIPDYARGFIVTNWPKDSPHSPLPLLSSILHKLVSIIECLYKCFLFLEI